MTGEIFAKLADQSVALVALAALAWAIRGAASWAAPLLERWIDVQLDTATRLASSMERLEAHMLELRIALAQRQGGGGSPRERAVGRDEQG